MLTSEQLLRRKSGIGGSDIAAIAGVSPWRNVLDVYRDKTTPLREEDEREKEWLYWGHRLEPVLAEEFEKRTRGQGIQFEYCEKPKILEHRDYPYFLATPDGFVYEEDEAGRKSEGIWEGKTDRFYHRWSGGVPLYYELQGRWYMMVTDVDFVWFSVLIMGNEYRQFRIERDPTIESDLIAMGAKFWSSVQRDVPPEEISQFEYLDLLYRNVTREKAYFLDQGRDSDMLRMFSKMAEIEEREKELEKEKSKIKAAIIKRTDGAGRIVNMDGKTVATYMEIEREYVDGKTLKKDMPKIHGKYLKKSKPYRQFRSYKQNIPGD